MAMPDGFGTETPSYLCSGTSIAQKAAWASSLARTIAVGPPHVSVYDLQVEPGTAFGKWYGKKGGSRREQAGLATEDTAAFYYREVSLTVEKVTMAPYAALRIPS